MKSIRASFMVPLFGLLSMLAACSGQSGTAEKGSSANAVAGQPADAPPEMMGHHPPGPAGLLFAALHEPINLTADQKTKIEAAIAELKPMGPPPGMEAHKTALAAAIRAGKIDTVALQPKGPTDVEREQHQAALAKAIGTLHSTLTKDQRVALVDAVSKHKHGPMGGKMGKGPKGGPMGHILEGLDLTKEQEDAIHMKLEALKPTEAEREAMKKEHEAMRTEMDARLQTFVADDFDAKAFVKPPAGATPAKMGDRHLKFLEIVTSVLTPAQREKLATKIEQGPPAFGPKN